MLILLGQMFYADRPTERQRNSKDMLKDVNFLSNIGNNETALL